MSLANCIKSAGKALSSKDAKAIQAIADQKVSEGMDIDQAEREAVQEYQDKIASELDNIASRVETEGGEIKKPEVLAQAAAKGLPMDKESRMQRAKDMGFDVYTVYYHGTKEDFDKFEIPYGGLYLSESPDIGTLYEDVTSDIGGVSKFYIKSNVLDLTENTDNQEMSDAALNDLNERFDDTENIDGYEKMSDVILDGMLSSLGRDVQNEVMNYLGLSYDAVKYNDVQTGDPDLDVSTVIFDNSDIRSTEAAFDPEFKDSPNLLAQKDKEGAERGFFDPSQNIIKLTKASDLSSFIHESGHLFLELEKVSSQSNFTKDHQVILDWLGVKSFDDIKTEHHEKWARGFEAYLFEGKVPSPELRTAFQRFSEWIKFVYKDLRNLNVELTDDIRQVMDRMLATDEQIAQTEAQQEYKPLFTDAAIIGMTDTEYKSYKERAEKAKTKTSETLQKKLFNQLFRQKEKWWNDELKIEKELVKEELLEQKVYKASTHLRQKGTENKINSESVRLLFDKIPPQLISVVSKESETTADDMAAMFDYGSGHEMLLDIMDKPKLTDEVNEQADARMKKKHGDILHDGTIEQEAIDAAHNEEQGKLILQELRALTKKQGKKPPFDRKALRVNARDVINKTPVNEIRPDLYRRAEIKAAQRAQKAFDSGDNVGAIQAKAQQAANFYLWKEASLAREGSEKIQRFTKKFNRKTVRERLGKSGNGYLNQIDSILNRFDFRKSPPKEKINIVDWENERRADGDNIELSKLVRSGERVHYKSLPYGELIGVHDSLKNIDYQSLRAFEYIVNKQKVEFQEVKDQLLEQLEKLKTIEDNTALRVTQSDKLIYRARAELSKLTDMGSLVLWLDNNERVGLAHSLIMQPINESFDEEFKLYNEVAAPILDLIKNRDKETIARHNSTIVVPVLGSVKFHQIIAVALNTGTESNLDKLTRGEKILDPDGNQDLDTLNEILKPLTKADWDLVQKIWDQTDLLYKPLADVAERQTGIRPPKIDSRVVETAFGDYKGGYYPIKYDPYRNDKAAANEAKKADEAGLLFESFFARPNVDAGSRYERTTYAAPLRLSLDVIQNHLQETIHYITHYESVKQVHKLINDSEIKAMIKSKVGTEEYNQMKPWLQAVAKDGKESEAKAFFEKFLQRFRFGVTLGTMGFKASTGLMQFAGLANTIAELNSTLPGKRGGTKHVAAAARFMFNELSLKKIQEKYDAAAQDSKVLKHRMKTMDREIRNAMNRLQDKTGFLADVQEVSMKHIAVIQTYMVDSVSWYAAYNAKLEEFSKDVGTGTYNQFKETAHQRAVRYADWVVVNVQGSGAVKDLSAVMRNQNEWFKQMTMFMTFFAKQFNRERTLVREVKAGQAGAVDIAVWTAFSLMLPVLYEMTIRGEIDGEDDGEEFLTSVALTSVNGVPFVRDISNGILSRYGYNSSPVISVLGGGVEAARSALIAATDPEKEITKSQVKRMSKAVGAFYGVPGVNQVWATGDTAYKVLAKGEDRTFRELLITGPKK